MGWRRRRRRVTVARRPNTHEEYAALPSPTENRVRLWRRLAGGV